MTRPREPRWDRYRVQDNAAPKRRGGLMGDERRLDDGDGAFVLDEIVVGAWLHVERMDDDTFHVRLGSEVYAVHKGVVRHQWSEKE